VTETTALFNSVY